MAKNARRDFEDHFANGTVQSFYSQSLKGLW
jgi:hypothetical protein